LAPIIQCLQDVVVVDAVKRGLGAVMGTCPRLVPRLVLVLTQSDHLDVGASLDQVEVAVVHQARLAVIQITTNSFPLVRGPLELLAEITRLSVARATCTCRRLPRWWVRTAQIGTCATVY